MLQSANLGYPRIGARRELKHALERYWKGEASQAELLETARIIRQENWQLQRNLGLDIIPSNDFSLYDQVLDTAAMLGAIPRRFGWSGGLVDPDTYFGMARGVQREGLDAPAMEMTKWFDTNYHYIVPEFVPTQPFKLASTKAIDEFKEALQLGIRTRPVLLGPVSFLMLGKSTTEEFDLRTSLALLTLLDWAMPVYETILQDLAKAGADWVQMDEPCLALDLNDAQRSAYKAAYAGLSCVPIKLMLTTYFGGLRDNLPLVAHLPVDGLHIDLVRAPEQLDEVLAVFPDWAILSMGLVDGRNVWRTDIDQALAQVERACDALGEDHVMIAPSCSLQFSPCDLEQETSLDGELKSWLAFARQKVAEVVLIKRAMSGGDQETTQALANQRHAVANHRLSAKTNVPAVKERLAGLQPDMLRRASSHAQRKTIQSRTIALPILPTTTIGSFPQTGEVRAKRAAYRKGEISREEYEAFLRSEIERTIRFQEKIGLDVLVHGEFERTDMVEYFGEQLTGIAFTEHAWVQSYGSRCVRPPILYGDVERLQPMTVAWTTFAQALTQRPVKGMLTGPVTILEWSFVRDDQPRADTCRQLALAIRDEVKDLEDAGLRIIQIDEPALREGLPLREVNRQEYLRWAVDCFRLATAVARDDTQIHTHMCYGEFNDILASIVEMDADAISIESSRSNMEMLHAFSSHRYPNDIGPGVYDIHSARVPTSKEMERLLEKALVSLDKGQLWVNPDCGLKTRSWKEVESALFNMVMAAHAMREKFA